MSKKHPVIVVTGSSGAGTSTVKKALESIFFRLKIRAATIEGDSFHRYDRKEMRVQMKAAAETGENFSHFGGRAYHFNLI